jgi:hypothetical protein
VEDGRERPAQAKLHETPISKITRAKWTGGVAQLEEHLLCKLEALSSNSTPTHKKNDIPNVKTVSLLSS